MNLQSEIKKAINTHSKKYRAIKVYKVTLDESCTMWIEVAVKKRKIKLTLNHPMEQ